MELPVRCMGDLCPVSFGCLYTSLRLLKVGQRNHFRK